MSELPRSGPIQKRSIGRSWLGFALLDRFPALGYSFFMHSPLKSASVTVVALLAALCLSHPAGAVEIVAPKDGEVIPIGAELVIQVQPSPGDDIDRVYLAHSEEHMNHNPQTDSFEHRN